MRINKIWLIVLFAAVGVFWGVIKAIELPCVDVENPRLPVYSKLARSLNDVLSKNGFKIACYWKNEADVRVSFNNIGKEQGIDRQGVKQNIIWEGNCKKPINVLDIDDKDIILAAIDWRVGQFASVNIKAMHTPIWKNNVSGCYDELDASDEEINEGANILYNKIKFILDEQKKKEPFLTIKKINDKKAQLDYNVLSIYNPMESDDLLHGEYYLSKDLESMLRSLGYNVKQHFIDDNEDNKTSGVNVFIRGYFKYVPPFSGKEATNIMYLFYPIKIDENDSRYIKNRGVLEPINTGEVHSLFVELPFYDAIAVASKKYAKMLQDKGYNAFYVPQFTNVKRFNVAPDEKLKTDILFVGSGGFMRESVRFAKESGFDVSIYGDGFNGAEKGKYVDNDELGKYYSSAKIVLNDHRPDMRKFGFINNRIFDATASGALVVSDYMKEIEDIYGDAIPMYKNKEELAEILKYYLSNENERLEKARRAQKITLENFGLDKVGKELIEIARSIKKN